MELLNGTIKECKFAQGGDVISSMPDLVITNIMNRLPIQDAVRTGILSRSWRYKWTLLNQLVLDNNFFAFLAEKGEKTNYGKIISRLLLHLKGAITKFYFDIQEEIYSIIDEYIAQCPLLKIMNITYGYPIVQIKLVEIAKLENLKNLSLPLCVLDNIVTTSSSIFQLGDHLPKLQELHLNFRNYKFVGEDGGRKWVCNAFPSLKTLTLHPIDFSSGIMFSWAFEMIWGSPNLQTLNIKATYANDVPPPVIYSPEVDCNTLGQLQLRHVVFSSFRGSENEVYLIKCLLASSPLLKRIAIYSRSSAVFGGDSGKLIFSTKLLKFHRASPLAEVDLCWT